MTAVSSGPLPPRGQEHPPPAGARNPAQRPQGLSELAGSRSNLTSAPTSRPSSGILVLQLQEGREGAGEGAKVLTVREALRVDSERQSSAAEEGRGPTDVSACASALAPHQGQGQHPELSPSARPGLRAQSEPGPLCPPPSPAGWSSFLHQTVRWWGPCALGQVGPEGGSHCPPRPPTLCPWLSPVTPPPWALPAPVSSARFRAGLLPGLQAHPLAVPGTGPSGDPKPRAPLCRTSRETLACGVTLPPLLPSLSSPPLCPHSPHTLGSGTA